MKEIILLTKILLKSSTSDSKQVGDKKTKGFGRIVFFVLAYGYIIGFMAYISYSAIKSLMLINQPAVFLNLVFVMLLGIGTMQIVITSLNILYFSKDLDFLLPLPITSIKIVISKLNCLVVSQYIMSALLVLPGIVMYGYLLELELAYYIVAILTLLLFPLILVAIVSLIVTIVMRFTKIIKNKEVIQYLTILLTLILIIGIQFFANTTNDNASGEEIAKGLLEVNGVVKNVSGIFPIVDLAINSIINYNNIKGIINLSILAILSIGGYFIFAFAISRIYVKTVISLTTEKNKKSKNIDTNKDIYVNDIFIAYIKKEFKLLVRNPIFFMQCVLPSIIFPIIIAVPAFMGVKDTGIDMNLLRNDLSLIINSSYGVMGTLTIIIFFFILNYTSVTAISRDGQNAVFMKYIPIELDKQIIFKIMPGIILNIIPIIYTIIFGVICIPNIQGKTYISVFIIALLINILNNFLMIIVDLKNPKLKWITEQAVVKQNINMLFVIAFVGIEIVLVIVLGNVIKDVTNLVILLSSFFLIAIIIVKKYISSNKEKIFEKII